VSEVDWRKIGSGERFETIIAVLLSTLHPDSERIDGAGGDEGRDHQLRTATRLDIWQSKYFLDRLSIGNRKNQILSSLQSAAAHQPDTWTLVTPMEATPAELRWFDGLQSRYPFPLVWRRGSWLTARLAENPGIARYFMSATEEYVALLRELQQEQDALVDGLVGAQARLESLSSRIDAANPFYRVEITVSGGQLRSVALIPKYKGAERDSPITVKFNVSMGTSPADEKLKEALQDALDWGEEVHIPAENVSDFLLSAPHGLGSGGKGAAISIGPANVVDPDIGGRLAVRSPEGKLLASLPVRFNRRVVSQRGVTLGGADRTGAIQVRVRVDLQGGRGFLRLAGYEEHPPLLPGEMLPALRFWHHAVAPNQCGLELGGAEAFSTSLTGGENVPADYIRIIEDLNRLQAITANVFPVPDLIAPSDRVEITRAVRLLDGERLSVGTKADPLILTHPNEATAAEIPVGPQVVAIAQEEPYVATIAGHAVDLGECTYYMHPVEFSRDDEGGIEAGPPAGTTAVVEVGLGRPPVSPASERRVIEPGGTASSDP
jgi:hypothetical protein